VFGFSETTTKTSENEVTKVLGMEDRREGGPVFLFKLFLLALISPLGFLGFFLKIQTAIHQKPKKE